MGRPLAVPDEIRVAEIGREMSLSGDVVVPRLGGESFLEKPPLYFAAVACAYRIFGVSDGAARIPTAIATALTLLLVFLVGRRFGGPLAGVASVAALATTVLFARYSQQCLVDSWLGLFVALGTWAFVHSLPARGAKTGDPRPPTWSILVFWLAVSLGYLTKGLVIGVLLVAPLLAALLWRRKRAAFGWLVGHPWAHTVGIAGALVAMVLWPLALYQRGGSELLDDFLVQNTLYRALPGEDYVGGHQRPPWYYIGKLGGFLPGLLVLPFACSWISRRATREKGDSAPGSLEDLAILAWVLPIGLILLSIPGTKRNLYLLPLTFAPAVVVGVGLAIKLERKRLLRLMAVLAVLFLVGNRIWTGMSSERRDNSAIAHDLADLGQLNDSLLGYRLDERTRATIPFRTGFIVTNITDPKELVQTVATRPGSRVLTSANLSQELRSTDGTAQCTPVQSWTLRKVTYTLYSVAVAPLDTPR